MAENLKRYGDWCLVTGASSGLGLEFARQTAAAGMNQVLVARRRERLEELARELEGSHGVEARVIDQDLAEPGSTDRVFEQAGELPLGLLVLNAGFGYTGRFTEMEQERMERMVALNCASVATMARRFIPGMVERGRGAVIIVSSVLGFLPGPYISVYSATKAFDLMLGESLRPELRRAGLELLNLCPAMTETEFHDVASGGRPGTRASGSRMADPADIVRMALGSLGRKSTVFPREGWAASMVTRLLPRKWVAGMVARFTGSERALGDWPGRLPDC